MRLTDLQNDHKSLRTGLVREKGIITSAYVCLKPLENPAYLQYLLHSYDTQKYFYGLGGGVRQSIGFKDIRYIKVPLPPRDEQDQIVRYLDWKVSQINKLINVKRLQIGLLREQQKAVVIDVIQKQNEHKKMKYLVRIKSGDALINSLLSDDNTLYPVYGGGKRIGYYSQSNASEKNILIGRVGANCGCVTVPESNCWATDNALIVKTEENITYLAYLLSAADLNRLNESNAQPLITGSKVLNHTTPYTSNIDEQQAIVVQLDAKCARIDKVIETLTEEIALFAEYCTRLISDAVTGKLDVRGVVVPEYEAVEDVVGSEDVEDEEEVESEE